MHVRAIIRAALIGALALCPFTPVSAQVAQTRAIVVASCGSVTLPTNDPHDLYMDQAGNLCGSTASAPSSAAGNSIAPIVGGTQTAYVAKASAANLYGFSATMGATAGFLVLLNAATAPGAAAAITPVECIPVPANGYVARRQHIPDRFGAGLTIVVSTSCSAFNAVAPLVTAVEVQ